ncbi:hypothetical protein AMATHDRAFT_72391 [Amanita thiersii Skay4041]|uniref:Cyclin C-terminal domain-containing protein n=1 Tax=Amanita thiersii Skay4041 TaxID=703135 RepID=A0A2A9P0J9_9AGAR|nr:hypothetical protein AMATHDRAFT_72391 [Amanita thiersii Skay4041]
MTSSPAPDGTAHDKPLYEASTQFRNWRYSPEQLTKIRKVLNVAAVTAIRHNFEVDEPGSSANVSFLDADEELLLVKLYISKITQLCALFRFPEEVEATAITYLKRFYLKNTVMDWHPKNVMYVLVTSPYRLTALFLATKTTNNPISIDEYTSRIPKTVPSDVLDLEFLVAQSLGFEFAVWHAHRALWGIWLDIQVRFLKNMFFNSLTIIKNYATDSTILSMSEYNLALNYVRASRLTDAEFIHTPSQVALAAFSLVAPDLALQWTVAKIPRDASHSGSSMSTLPLVLESIKSLIRTSGHPPDVESVREVDRRLRICKNPEKVPGTRAYMAKRAEEERIAEEKRARKIEEVQKATAGDPFGDELQNTGQLPGLVDYDDDDNDD